MNIITCCLCILALSVFPCYARLGETVDECHQRYGEPDQSQTIEAGNIKLEVFSVKDFTIKVYYSDRKAVVIIYIKDEISPDEAKTILDKEANGESWEATAHFDGTNGASSTYYKRKDGVEAVCFFHASPSELDIYTSASTFNNARHSVEKANVSKSTNGL